MKATLFGQTASSASTSVVNYLSVSSISSASPNTSETTRQQVVPAATTFTNLMASLVTAPGGTASYTYTLRKNGVDTALTTTITGAATSNTDSTNSVSFAAGDLASISITPSGTPASSAGLYWNMNQDSGNSTHYAVMLGGSQATGTLSQSAVSYSQLTGSSNGSGSWTSTEASQEIIAPTSGTLSNFFLKAETAPGSGKSYAFNIVKNGTPASFSATVSGTATTASDTTTTLSIVAGDTLSISATPSTTPALSRYSWGIQFTPTTAGESFFGFGSSAGFSTTTAVYDYPLSVGGNGTNSTETNRQMMIGSTTIKAFYIKIFTAPGVGTSRTFTLRQNAAGTTATSTISDTNTSGNITGLAISVGASDLMALQGVPAFGPAVMTNGAHMGVLTYIAAATPVTATQTATARITASFTNTQTATARIAKTFTSTQPATTRISVSSAKTQTATARISKTTTKTQTSTARITESRTKTQGATARIQVTSTKTQSAVASILVSGNFTKTQTATARISKQLTKTQTSTARLSESLTKTQGALARISKSINKTQTSTARIVASRSTLQTATARIQTATAFTFTQTAIARIESPRRKTQSATARIVFSRSATQTATASIGVFTPGKSVFWYNNIRKNPTSVTLVTKNQSQWANNITKYGTQYTPASRSKSAWNPETVIQTYFFDDRFTFDSTLIEFDYLINRNTDNQRGQTKWTDNT